MLGTLDPRQREVTVIGGGVAGLLAAYRLDQAGYEVRLLEATGRLGGLIQTTRTPYGIAEAAAHSFLASPAVARLFEELAVPLAPVREGSKARYILRGARMRRFPLTPLEASAAFARAYFTLADRHQDPAELTLEDWGRRHLGRAAVEYALGPFVRGVYAVSPAEISVEAAFPALRVPPGHSLLSFLLHKRRTRPRGEKRGRKPMTAPREGMASLTAALEARLRERLGPRLQTGAPVAELPRAGNVVLSVPAYAAAELLRAADPALAHAVAEVAYAPLVSVTAFIERSQLPREPQGVGVLMPESEGRDCLGILFNSSAFENRVTDPGRHASFTMMLGGSARPELVLLPEAELRALVEREFAALLGARPAHLEIHRWERAIPRYDSRLLTVWQRAREGWCAQPGHVLFANWTGQVSLRGMMELSERLAPPAGAEAAQTAR
jgi:oxygen-dependent protoporphyrinogen oxidase